MTGKEKRVILRSRSQTEDRLHRYTVSLADGKAHTAENVISPASCEAVMCSHVTTHPPKTFPADSFGIGGIVHLHR